MSQFETNGLKALYFQGVETQALSTRGQADVINLHRLTVLLLELISRALRRASGLTRPPHTLKAKVGLKSGQSKNEEKKKT